MTLLITVAAGDGIVMGADSALTWREAGEELTLARFTKVVPVPHLHMGISIAGSARIGRADRSTWISTWVRQFALEASRAESFTAFANEFVEALNEVADPGDNHIFHLGAWVQATEREGNAHLVPRVFSIGKEDRYGWTSMLPDEFTADIIAWRGTRREPYPMRIVSSGIPPYFANWIATTGAQQHRELIGSPVPYPEVTAVAEYVRFLIESVAELSRIARRPGVVEKPVETLVLFPESINMMSTRW